MGDYRQSNKLIYQAILDQGVSERIKPKLQDLGSRMLATSIRNLTPETREELWVTEAISWLGQLDTKRAEPLLKRILSEKKCSSCSRSGRRSPARRPERPLTTRATPTDGKKRSSRQTTDIPSRK